MDWQGWTWRFIIVFPQLFLNSINLVGFFLNSNWKTPWGIFTVDINETPLGGFQDYLLLI